MKELILFLLRQSRWFVMIAVLTGAISGLGSTGLLALFKEILTDIEESGAAPMWAAFLGLCLVVPLSRAISEVLLIRLGQETIFELRMNLSRRVLDAPLRQLETLGAHRILSTLTDDIPTLTTTISLIPILCINLSIFLGCLAYLGWLSPQLLGVVLIFLLLGVLSYQFPTLRALRHLRAARELNDRLYHHFRAITRGNKEFKLHRKRRDAFLDQELEPTAAKFRDRNILGLNLYTYAASWGQTLVFFVVGLLLFGVPAWTDEPPELLVGYTLILLYLMTPLQVLTNSLPSLSRAGVALARISRIGLELTQDLTGGEERELPEKDLSAGTLELRGITHTYRQSEPGEGEDFALGPIDLTLRGGEILFIVGGNGSGKTTLIKLLTGLYPPDGGTIRLGGERVTEENREAFRQYFSVVFFDFHLFDRLFGLEGPDLDERAERLLETLRLASKVQVKDGRLTDIELSQGQRKRLALITAILEDRPIYVFDEWAADQDPVFKEIFYRQILPALRDQGKSVVVISHDDRYYDVGDHLLKLEDGKIVSETELSSSPAIATMTS